MALALATPATGGASVEESGVRVTVGDAVACPTLRTDDGRVVALSFLPAEVAVGARVTVRGRYGVTTRCRGRVLVVVDEEASGDAAGSGVDVVPE